MDNTELSQLLKSILGENLSVALENADAETLAPVAAVLGLKPQTLCVIIKLIPKFLSGDIDLKGLLPSLIPVFLNYILSLNSLDTTDDKTAAEQSPAANENATYENLKTIIGKDYSSFDVYLQSDSASS